MVAEELAGLTVVREGTRVLDVGCGQGTQALGLARRGCDVVGLDPSAELLDRFRAALEGEPPEVRSRVRLVRGTGEQLPGAAPGPFDLVLCHGVLMYVPDSGSLQRLLAAITTVTAAGTVLSLLVRNGCAPAMRSGLLGDGGAALRAFDDPAYTNRLGLPARAHTPEELDAVLAPMDWERLGWFGVRVFSDHRDEPAPPPTELAALLAAEVEAGRRDPYRHVAALLHVLYRASG